MCTVASYAVKVASFMLLYGSSKGIEGYCSILDPYVPKVVLQLHFYKVVPMQRHRMNQYFKHCVEYLKIVERMFQVAF